MIVYDVATKVLDIETFPQHIIPDLISGITFIVSLSQEKPLRWKEKNTHFHAHTHTHTHARTHTHTHTHRLTQQTHVLLHNTLRNTLSVYFPLGLTKPISANISLFKFNNRNTRKRFEIYSKLHDVWHRSGVCIVNFEHILHLFTNVSIVQFKKVIFSGIELPHDYYHINY